MENPRIDVLAIKKTLVNYSYGVDEYFFIAVNLFSVVFCRKQR